MRDETDVASCCPEVTDGVECSTDRSAEGGRDVLLCRGYVGVASRGAFPYDRSHDGEEPDAPDDDALCGHALLDQDCSVHSCDGMSPVRYPWGTNGGTDSERSTGSREMCFFRGFSDIPKNLGLARASRLRAS